MSFVLVQEAFSKLYSSYCKILEDKIVLDNRNWNSISDIYIILQYCSKPVHLYKSFQNQAIFSKLWSKQISFL
jgi:hypothetical protein